MRYCLLFIIIFLPMTSISPQDDPIARLMTKRYIDCDDINYNSLLLIPQYYYSGQIDSARLINNYWIEKCGYEKESRIAEILFSIEDNSFDEDKIPDDFFRCMTYYKMRVNPTEADKWYYDYYYKDLLTTYNNYFRFIGDLSLNLLLTRSDSLNNTERLTSEFYSGSMDSALIKIQALENRGTKLYAQYMNNIGRLMELPSFHYNIFAGLWIPTGKEIKGFGPLPLVGGYFGLADTQYDFGLSIYLRFGSSRNNYTIVNEGRTYITNKQFGFGISLDAAKKLVFDQHYDVSLLGGLYIDGYNPPKSEVDLGDKRINSFGLVAGAGFGWRPWSIGGTQFNLQFRYNQFLTSSSDLDGPLGSSFTVTLGTAFNLYANLKEYLDFVKYQW